jgi:hypothetical protein
MKKIFVLVLFVLFTFTSQAQNVYSMQNLEKVSSEDLIQYLEKAQKQKKLDGLCQLRVLQLLLPAQF